MIKNIFLMLLIFILIQPLETLSQNKSSEQAIKELQDNGEISLSLPLYYAYKNLCASGGINTIANSIQEICTLVFNSSLCKDIPAKDRRNCKSIEKSSSIPLSIWEFLRGCSEGVVNSVKALLNFSWSVMKWIWNNTTKSEVRKETIEKADEYIEIARLYLHTEYEKAYENQTEPFRETKAMCSCGGYHRQHHLDKAYSDY